jgi:hypothetical protein
MLYHWVVQNEWNTWLCLYKLMRKNAVKEDKKPLQEAEEQMKVRLHEAALARIKVRVELMCKEPFAEGNQASDLVQKKFFTEFWNDFSAILELLVQE